MQNHPNIHQIGARDAVEPAPEEDWQTSVADLLRRAAVLCVENGVDADAFMRGAWATYVEMRPGMRDYIEELQLRQQLDELRKAGRIGEA